MLPKLPFFGTVSLYYAAYHLNRALRPYTLHSITARGPLAGWICAHAKVLSSLRCTVQARGLAAQEYRYAHEGNHFWFFKWIHQFRVYQYEYVERQIYGTSARATNITVHAVSEALKNYLIITFNTPNNKIFVEHTDIPHRIDAAIIGSWRATIRTKTKYSGNRFCLCV